MQPPAYNKRAQQLHFTLSEMEQTAPAEQLFALGYLIPQIELVAEHADIPDDADFDQVFETWLSQVFNEDDLSQEDRDEIHSVWHQARLATPR
ncbi:hypothetical protein BFW38_09915 [Terasakiispira papahanaumokuakeensis]|uniref:YfcL protein n=1 Tax=Terasakiispira papahanaumokuakeensis TaxID=197479 RepID=A0A1E2V9X6_9GAMM|nr:YfcL family protein [Terasakiispira papahanaumokuakeensis]ODC03810.1 hypothetical protein BFW38_09915 [Terasakiispira papahanaumokuakeensis]